MELDAVTDSISTMKLTETHKKSFKETWWHVDATMNFAIENAKQLISTPEHKKNRTHYFFEITQARLLREKLRNLEKHEKNNVYGDYSKTKEYLDLKRSAEYWTEKLFKDSNRLKEKLGIPGLLSVRRQALAQGRERRITKQNAICEKMLESNT